MLNTVKFQRNLLGVSWCMSQQKTLHKRSCREVATDYDIKPTTLRRHCMMNQEKLDGRDAYIGNVIF